MKDIDGSMGERGDAAEVRGTARRWKDDDDDAAPSVLEFGACK